MFRLVIVALVLCGCSQQRFHSEDELISFVRDEEHGLIKTATAKDFKIQITYKPTDLLVSQDIGISTVNENEIDLFRSKYAQYYYFVVSLSRNNREALHNSEGGLGQYGDLVETLSFRMNDYVSMTTNTADTIPVADFLLNRTFGASSSTDILFVFSKQKIVNKDWVQFNLNEFGLGVGNQRFRFRCKDLNKILLINFNTTPNS